MERPAGGGGARVSDGAPLVVVVGAGAAGLAAAATLRASRRARVIVLEARNRLGGRCMSVPIAGAEGMGGRSRAEAAVDLGAGWVHGAQDVRNPLAALVASRGGVHPLVPSKRNADARGGERRPLSALLISHDMDTHLLTDAATGAEFDVECVAAAAGVFEAVLEECAKVRARHPPGREWSFAGEAAAARERLEQAGDIPMLSYAERRVWSWFVGRAAGTWFAAETADPGAAHGPDTGDGGTDAGAPLRGTPAFVHGGLQALLRPLAAGVDIRFSNPVKRVCRHASGVTLLLESGGRIEADYCVCTIPLGVLKVAPGAGVTTLAQSYQNRNLMPINSEEMRPPPRFDPPLPDEHRAALVASRVAHENRVALRFARAFWPQEVTFLGACADSVEDCSYFVNLSPLLGGEPVLLLLLTGARAFAMETSSEAVIRETAMRALRAALPAGCAVEEPLSVRWSRWGQDPWARGAYAQGELLPTPASELAAPAGRLHFAGDHVARRWTGTVHGALDSGKSTAKAILKAIDTDLLTIKTEDAGVASMPSAPRGLRGSSKL